MLVFLAEQLGDERELILNAEEYPYRLFSYHYSSNLAEEVVLRALNGEDPVKRPRKVKEIAEDNSLLETEENEPLETSEPRKPREKKEKVVKPAKQNAVSTPKKKQRIG